MKRSADAVPGATRAATPPRRILQRACRRRADGNHAAAFRARPLDCGRGFGADRVALGIDDVIFDAIDCDRLERAVADMQRDRGALDAARAPARRAARS